MDRTKPGPELRGWLIMHHRIHSLKSDTSHKLLTQSAPAIIVKSNSNKIVLHQLLIEVTVD